MLTNSVDPGVDLLKSLMNTQANSGAGSDNNHAHPDTSMKLGRNVY